MTTFCPASMCPLIAPDGSPWTGQKNSACEREACGWFDGKSGHCMGASAAVEQVGDASRRGWVLQLGHGAKRYTKASPKTYDCARAHECQWQVEAGDGLCPPRLALSQGLDPKVCNY